MEFRAVDLRLLMLVSSEQSEYNAIHFILLLNLSKHAVKERANKLKTWSSGVEQCNNKRKKRFDQKQI